MLYIVSTQGEVILKFIKIFIVFIIALIVYSLSSLLLDSYDLTTSIISSLILTILFFFWTKNEKN